MHTFADVTFDHFIRLLPFAAVLALLHAPLRTSWTAFLLRAQVDIEGHSLPAPSLRHGMIGLSARLRGWRRKGMRYCWLRGSVRFSLVLDWSGRNHV